jgi:hypothetical protein
MSTWYRTLEGALDDRIEDSGCLEMMFPVDGLPTSRLAGAIVHVDLQQWQLKLEGNKWRNDLFVDQECPKCSRMCRFENLEKLGFGLEP